MNEEMGKSNRSSRRRFLRWLGYAGAGTTALATGLGYVVINEMQWLRLKRVRIPLSGRASRLEGMRIALLADFHLYPHTTLELISEAIDMANRLQPDLTLLAGDYVLSTADAVFDLAPQLSRLDAKLGVFAILGNHDHWKGVETVTRGLNESGVQLLRNQSLELTWHSQRFQLAGLDDGWVRRHDLIQALDGQTDEIPTLLMMHEPDFADELSTDGRIDIQFSGHSHGGQVRFPLIGSPFLPPYGRKYDQGLYRVGDMWLYTNVGLGVTVPVRFNCPPEVTEITLGRA